MTVASTCTFWTVVLTASVVVNQPWTFKTFALFVICIGGYYTGMLWAGQQYTRPTWPAKGQRADATDSNARQRETVDVTVIYEHLKHQSNISLVDFATKRGRTEAASEIAGVALRTLTDTKIQMHTMGHLIEWEATVSPVDKSRRKRKQKN